MWTIVISIDEDDSIERVPSSPGTDKRKKKRKRRKATRPQSRRWTNNVVPYVIAPGTFSECCYTALSGFLVLLCHTQPIISDTVINSVMLLGLMDAKHLITLLSI